MPSPTSLKSRTSEVKSKTAFREFRPPKTCPVCGHSDRCKTNGQAVACFRASEDRVNGYRKLKTVGECSTFVPSDVFVDPAKRQTHKKIDDGPDLGAESKRYQAAAVNGRVDRVATELNVSADSLRSIGIGFDDAGRPTFPESDGNGSVIGLNHRMPTGKKLVGKGQRRGLIVPVDFDTMPDPVFAVEGPSDLAAALTMSVTAIARPSAKTGGKFLAKRLVNRDVIVIGDNDEKSDGSFPGLDGAKSIAGQLTRAFGRPIQWAMPPEGTKDVRDFLRQHPDDPVAAGRELLAHVQRHKQHDGKSEPRGGMTELWLAERFVSEHGRDLRYSDSHGWTAYDGTRWRRDDTGDVERRAKKTVRKLYVEAAKLADDLERKRVVDFARSFERHSRLVGVLAFARTEPGIPIRADQLDADPWLLNVRNGTVDLRTGELREHRPADLITKIAPVDFDPEALAPRWHSFLNEIFASNYDLIQFVQRAIGAALTGIVRDHVLHILHGSGANGKSTLVETVKAILGDYAQNAAPRLLMQKRNETHTTDLAELRGVRFVACAESGEGHRLDEERVKNLTGGDTIRGRFMRQDFFEFRPSHTVFLATNHKPEVRGTDLGMWRRVRLWPFDVSIPEDRQDAKLPETLLRERAGIMAWAVRGCVEWQADGLGKSEAVATATEAYRSDSDAVSRFIDEECVTDRNARVSAGQLHEAYLAWAGGRINIRRFNEQVRERGYVLDPTRSTGGRRFWEGIGLPKTDATLADHWAKK